MAIYWTAKPVDAVYRYTWTPPVADGDAVSSFDVVSSTGATIDGSELVGDDVVLFISGGVVGTAAVFELIAYTDDGEELPETIYLPIKDGGAVSGQTARDVCDFALRKIVGDGETASATQLGIALELLNDTLALWRIDGLDLGLGILAANDDVVLPDEYTTALKYNLRLACHAHYGADLGPFDVNMADTSKRLIGNRLLQLSDLTMPATLSRPRDSVADLF